MGRIELNGEVILRTLKPYRRKWNILRRLYIIAFFVLLFGTIAYICSGLFFAQYASRIYSFFPLVIILVAIGIPVDKSIKKSSEKAKKAYAEEYKRLIAKPTFENNYEDAKFESICGYPRESFNQSNLIPLGGTHTYQSEDLITGRYHGVTFQRGDVRITHVVRTKNGRKTVVDADGRFLEITFPVKINGVVKIEKRRVVHLGDDGSIKMEDVDFNQKFKVTAKDKQSAYYLLTPHFMEYIKRLYHKDDDVRVSFNGQKAYFLQSGKGGIFEPPKGKIEIWDEVRKCKAELKEIEEIIDVLQRNELNLAELGGKLYE